MLSLALFLFSLGLAASQPARGGSGGSACVRGLAWCESPTTGEAGNCCSDYECSLDDIRLLPDPEDVASGRPICWYQGGEEIGTVDFASTSTTGPGTCQCGVKGGADNNRIVGGQETEEHEYPWQVGLVRRDEHIPWCGGTLISSTHVLTAAHCTEGSAASSIRVLLGEHNIADSVYNRVDVAEIINHPNYNSQTLDNDYAILRLANPIDFTIEVSPACLPADLSATYAGVLAIVTGWGTLSSGGSRPSTLQEVEVTVTTNVECNSAYDSITSNMVCAADSGKDSCQGDSGGPLIAPENGRQALIGVVSWGIGCASDRFPGVYARVTEKMSWILANTAGTFSSTCSALN